MAKTAFIGLGVMGYPMAGHLAKAGHEVTVYNRTKSKADDWVKAHGGTAAPTPAEAAKGAEFVFACVGNDDDVRSVTIAESGAFGAMEKNAVFIDHTTASATLARELAERAEGFAVIDGPVSGGQAGAENGALTVMCGGDEAAFERAAPIIDAYAKSRRLLGPAGAGQLTKMVNQIAIAGLLQGLAEAMNFAAKSGLSIPDVTDVISKGAAGSWQMENRAATMGEDKFDFGFAVDWMRKDLGICLEEAKLNDARLPVTALVDQFYGDVQDMGGGRWDTSSLLRRLTKT